MALGSHPTNCEGGSLAAQKGLGYGRTLEKFQLADCSIVETDTATAVVKREKKSPLRRPSST